MIQDALPGDRAPATPHGFVKTQHPECSDTIGRKKEAGADRLLFARMLDDLGGEPPLPECPLERQPGNSSADDQDPWSAVHRFEVALLGFDIDPVGQNGNTLRDGLAYAFKAKRSIGCT